MSKAYLWYDLRNEVWHLYDSYEETYDSVEFLIDHIANTFIDTLFVADLKIAQYYLQNYKITHIRANKGNFYKFKLKDVDWISIDHVFRKPFVELCKELGFGEASGANVKKVVEAINSISNFKLGKDFTTIGNLAWKIFETFGVPNNIRKKYFSNDKKYKWFEERNIYKGGLCISNRKFTGVEIKNLYKYDKNSFFSWVMKYGKMPMGHSNVCKGKPVSGIEDRLLHIKWSAQTRFEGLAPLEDKELFLGYDMWLWGCELLELMNWYETLEIEYIEYMVFEYSEPDKQMGRFVDYYYPQKKTATGIYRTLVKLILNNIYGKFGECPYGTYSKQENGKIISYQSEEYIDYELAKDRSLAVASKITSLARTELLRSIRVACKGRPDKYFVYCDTDSMILTIPYNGYGNELGQFKFEGNFKKGKVLGKKCYMLWDGAHYECHAAGINRAYLEQDINGRDWYDANDRFSYGQKFKSPIFSKGKIILVDRELTDKNSIEKIDSLYEVYEEE